MRIFKTQKNILKTLIISILIILFTTTLFREQLLVYFYPIIKSTQKFAITSNVKDYEKIETDNFIIRYDESQSQNALMSLEIAEKYYNDMVKLFRHAPKNKIEMILYKNGDEMMKNTGLNDGSYPIGVYYGGVVHILPPEEWIEDDDNFEEIYEKDGPVVHEIAHYIVDEITNGNYPMWLTEGVALYAEYKITGSEWGKDMNDDYISIEDLEERFNELNQEVAYRKSFNIVKNMSDKWGVEKLNNMLYSLGKGNRLNKVTEAVFKVNLYEIR